MLNCSTWTLTAFKWEPLAFSSMIDKCCHAGFLSVCHVVNAVWSKAVGVQIIARPMPVLQALVTLDVGPAGMFATELLHLNPRCRVIYDKVWMWLVLTINCDGMSSPGSHLQVLCWISILWIIGICWDICFIADAIAQRELRGIAKLFSKELGNHFQCTRPVLIINHWLGVRAVIVELVLTQTRVGTHGSQSHISDIHRTCNAFFVTNPKAC